MVGQEGLREIEQAFGKADTKDDESGLFASWNNGSTEFMSHLVDLFENEDFILEILVNRPEEDVD